MDLIYSVIKGLHCILDSDLRACFRIILLSNNLEICCGHLKNHLTKMVLVSTNSFN